MGELGLSMLGGEHRAISSAVEHSLYTGQVGGSSPSSPTSLRSRSEGRLPRRRPQGEVWLCGAQKLTSSRLHRGRSCPYLLCVAEALSSPAPPIPVRKYYSSWR